MDCKLSAICMYHQPATARMGSIRRHSRVAAFTEAMCLAAYAIVITTGIQLTVESLMLRRWTRLSLSTVIRRASLLGSRRLENHNKTSTTQRDYNTHRSIYKYLDTGLPSLSLAYGDPLKLTSPAQHASR